MSARTGRWPASPVPRPDSAFTLEVVAADRRVAKVTRIAAAAPGAVQIRLAPQRTPGWARFRLDPATRRRSRWTASSR